MTVTNTVFNYEGVTAYLTLEGLNTKHLSALRILAPTLRIANAQHPEIINEFELYKTAYRVIDSNAYKFLRDNSLLFIQGHSMLPVGTPNEYHTPCLEGMTIKDIEFLRIHFPVVAQSRDEVAYAVDALFEVLGGLFEDNLIHVKSKIATNNERFDDAKNVTYLSAN